MEESIKIMKENNISLEGVTMDAYQPAYTYEKLAEGEKKTFNSVAIVMICVGILAIVAFGVICFTRNKRKVVLDACDKMAFRAAGKKGEGKLINPTFDENIDEGNVSDGFVFDMPSDVKNT